MAVYVLHIEPPYKHAKHYIGFTTRSFEARIADHLSGRGSPLVKAAIDAGCSVTLAHKWSCGTRGFERHLKNRKEAPRWCKCCGGRKRKPTFAAFRRKHG